MFDFHSFLIDFFKIFIFTTDKHSFHSKNFKFQILNLKKFKSKKFAASIISWIIPINFTVKIILNYILDIEFENIQI